MFSPTSLGQAIKYSFTFLYRLQGQKGPNPLATNLTLTRLPWVLVPSPQQLVKGPTLGVGLTGTPQHPLFERGKNPSTATARVWGEPRRILFWGKQTCILYYTVV